jgi:hypothetical protein
LGKRQKGEEETGGMDIASSNSWSCLGIDSRVWRMKNRSTFAKRTDKIWEDVFESWNGYNPPKK